MKKYFVPVLFAILLTLLFSLKSAYAQVNPIHESTQVTYQGQLLTAKGQPVDSGSYDISVTLYADPQGTKKIWRDSFHALVTNGVFSLRLGSQEPLPGAGTLPPKMWLGVSVDNSEETRPLTELSPVLSALTVPDHSITPNKLSTGYVGGIAIDGQTITGRGDTLNFSSGNGIRLTYDADNRSVHLELEQPMTPLSPIYWSETGNSGTDPSLGNYVGTSDNHPFEVHVDDGGAPSEGRQRVMRYEPNSTSPNLLGGQYSNSGTGVGIVIAGGGSAANPNIIASDFGTISGGDSNNINGLHGVIGGGQSNGVAGDFGTVGGGTHNLAGAGATVTGGTHGYAYSASSVGGGEFDSALGIYDVIGGGHHNITGGWGSTILGGQENAANYDFASIGGGEGNVVDSSDATISGGIGNLIRARNAFIGGGTGNTIDSIGRNAVISGGIANYITDSMSSIAGGGRLVLGKKSFGYNAPESGVPVQLESGHDNVAYFGNVNLMIGNTDSTARELRLYGPNLQHDYNSSARYSAFKSPLMGTSLTYTLPSSQGVANSVLTNDGAGILRWDATLGNGFWSTTGNNGTSPSLGNYIGTIDSNSFEVHINNSGGPFQGNKRVMRYEVNDTSANLIGGYNTNTVTGSDLVGVVIAGGGSEGERNLVTGSYGTISGGRGNITDRFSSITGGENNYTNGGYNVIGGASDTIVLIGDYQAAYDGILSGQNNEIRWNEPFDPIAKWAVIGGGDSNLILEGEAFIGGGSHNVAEEDFTVIGGGRNNDARYDGAVIGGGVGNVCDTYSFIGGGVNNNAQSDYCVIGGGYNNRTSQSNSIVGGGENNIAGGKISSVLGGNGNQALGYSSFIGGGHAIIATAGYSAIAGGDGNSTTGYTSFIGGGLTNQATGMLSTIGGGKGNIASGTNSVIGGGGGDTVGTLFGNTAEGAWSGILGGAGNIAHDTGSTVGGGINNDAYGKYSFVGGGGGPFSFGPVNGNYAFGFWSAIVGGYTNEIDTIGGFIGGGGGNFMKGSYDVIGGGVGNRVDSLAAYAAVITGGELNLTSQTYSSIGGGVNNLICTNGTGKGIAANIPGGDHLIAASYAQTVVGEYNKVQGASSGPSGSTNRITGDRLFIVGNGAKSSLRSNAFEVSENGHSIVYGQNGGGATAGAIYGATYQDNIIYGWGDIEGITASSSVINYGSFGIQPTVTYVVPGEYKVTLNLVDPYSGATITPSHISVTATIVSTTTTPHCLIVNTTPLGAGGFGPNDFLILISDPSNSCRETDARVMFHVCAR